MNFYIRFKNLFTQKTPVMARLLPVLIALLISAGAYAQPVTCDLSLSDNHLENALGGDLNANLIATGQIIRLKVLIGNFISSVVAPGGHFRLRIGLGNGLILRPGFNLATAALNDKFTWTYDLSGAQPQIVGNSIANLPDNYQGYADFELKANTATTSTVSFNLLISNPPGTTTPLSDPNFQNNSASNTYTIVAAGPLPVTFTQFNAVKKDCDINLAWKVESQSNLKKYEIEVSKDNSVFIKQGEVAGRSDGIYAYAFPLTSDLKTATLYIRVKSVDLDGSFRYTKMVSVPADCKGKWQLTLFPNPVSNETLVTVAAKEGVFDGKYKVSIIGSNGQLIKEKELTLYGAKSFPLSVSGLSSGKYHITVRNQDDTSTTVLDFEKL